MLADSWAAVARRTDDAAGIAEDAGFLDNGMFLSVCRPIGNTGRGLVLICPTVLTGGLVNYRREVNFGRELAHIGFTVARPQYVGCGNSFGGGEELTLDSMISDATAALRFVRATYAAEPFCFVGVRLGALVATALEDSPLLPLALWDPVVKGSDYFREAFRAELMRHVGSDKKLRMRSSDFLEHLNTHNYVEVVGEVIHRSFYESVKDEILNVVAADRRSVLLVELGSAGSLGRLEAALTEQGAHVAVASTSRAEAWWFQDERTTDTDLDAAGKSTVTWLLQSTDF